MPVPSVSFLIGVVVLGYLLTFVVFAILRVVTGVSIQRVGYSGLRRIAFSPRHGIRVTIRGVGFSPHRPTFALPTWCSFVITELCVTVDLAALQDGSAKENGLLKSANGHTAKEDAPSRSAADRRKDVGEEPDRFWYRLTTAKEQIKRLHRKIHWLRLVDLAVHEAEMNVTGVGSLSIERATLSVDTRSQTVDRSRLFQHHKAKPDTQRPAEWKSLIRSVLFTPEGGESTEILDFCTFNVHGLLHRDVEGLRDASIALKLGRFNVPYDDIELAKKNADLMRGRYAQPEIDSMASTKVSDTLDELHGPPNEEERLVHTLSESRKFVASILRGILEVQLAVGFFGLSRKLPVKGHAGRDVYFNLAMKEVGLDVLRLDPKSASHRMYFSPKDVAHQGLVTAISISAGIDDGHDHPERMVYIPMITATAKTTLPSRTIRYSDADSAGDKNTNILYANLVCTSPSIDLDPKHLPLVLEIVEQRMTQHQHMPRSNKHRLISQLLPKASVKLSVQEPVVRVSLPARDQTASEGDFDLLISSVSSMSLDVESSHSHDGSAHYGLASNYRHTSHQLYYQTAAGERHDLLKSDTSELKVDVNAIPDVTVMASGRLQTFTIFLIRPEICEGLRQIVKQLRKTILAERRKSAGPQASFLRRMPVWLKGFRIEGHDFGLQLAGVDTRVSKDMRGFMLELESWSTEYRAHRDEAPEPSLRRKSTPREKQDSEKSRSETPDSPRKRHQKGLADGRRLTIHLQNLEGLVVDSLQDVQPESFMSLPQFEIAFSTSTDSHGPLFHINSYAKTLLLEYSLYNHFAMGVAFKVIRRTFLDHDKNRQATPPAKSPTQAHLAVPGSPLTAEEIARQEITTLDFKTALLQVKARLPSDPRMMLQVYGLEVGRHRWATPFFRSKIARLYVRAPSTKSVWSRIITVKTLRADMRDLKRRASKVSVSDKSIDLAADTIRIGVPHSLVVHNIFDNITNIIKTTKQLHHHFETGTDEYVLVKEPEAPKHVPRISLRAQTFLFEIEDSSFDWKLGAIYRAGLAEQKQRLAREEVFRMKEKRIFRSPQRGNQGSSHMRTQSAHNEEHSRPRNKLRDAGKRRSRSTQPASRFGSDRRNVRYDTDGKCGLSDTTQLTTAQAREKLHRFNAQTWRARIDRVIDFQKAAMTDIRRSFFGTDSIPEDIEQNEPILALSQRPGIFMVCLSDLSLTIDKPSFPIDEFPRFLHDVGKGMPLDMKYGLVLPMSIQITTGETRFQLRDYPLPLLHVPALANGQSPRLPSLSMKADFVVAEEFRDVESQRSVEVMIVPPEKMAFGDTGGYAISVRRSISPVKTYSDMKFEINTSQVTRFTWGSSFQPALQDTMQVIEGFTKPPVDTSDRVGFWDKVRLSFHSRVNVAWKGDGDLHLILKGSRDPYVVTGESAGLVMVWRNDVRWNIARDPDPRKFMTVDSGDYILAVPDFNSYARHASHESDEREDAGSSTSSSNKKDAIFKKVVMKLSGNVRWLAGLMFERDVDGGGRSFESKPHYDVVLKHPDFAKTPSGTVYDAYRNFRSHHIHMSIAVAAPHDRDWSVSNLKPSTNYNSVHLTPRFFSHFFSWWKMFSGVMSLPVRQGPLWGVTQKKSKKFGRHIATIKYNLLLSPLFVSHIYKHKDMQDYEEDVVSATGLKMKLDSFMLDLHQRREHFDIQGHEDAASKRTSAMRINQAQLDFISADLRAISASIKGTTAQDIEKATEETLASLHTQTPAVDISKFTIPDNDLTWIDMDDFVELDWILPAESDPETKILPLGFAPRFTYFRQTDHGDSVSGDKTRSSPFGDEPTHYCVMSAKNDPRRVQSELLQRRLDQLTDQRKENKLALGDQELSIIRSTDNGSEVQKKLNDLKAHDETLQKKFDFLQAILDTLTHRLQNDDPAAVPGLETDEEFHEAHENTRTFDPDLAHMDAAPLADYSSDFNNRFIVHNPQIKWNNPLRNIILRYIHQNSQRRGFVYYMSRRAVKFILDILEEQRKSDAASANKRRESSFTAPHTPFSPDADDEATVQDRIEQLLRDGKDIVNADEPEADRQDSKKEGTGPSDEIATEYTPLNTYHFRLIAPQIQLQSEKNTKSAVLVTAKGMQLKVVQIMDKGRVNDEVSGLVQRRFTAAMESLQMFTTSTKTFSTESLHLYSGNRYGVRAGTCWPPWVPLEVMFEFQGNPYGFDRIVHRTSASLRYDKYNNLRLKYNDDVTGGRDDDENSTEEAESRLDHVWLEFPHFRCICDSEQYFAMYIIVMDLLLYNEPSEKTRSERLEKIMLASDFSDLTGAPEMVQMLQERIRQLEEIKLHFQVHEKFLDREGWKDRIVIDQDMASCEDELFFMLKAITTSQQRADDRRDQEHGAGTLRLHMSAREIAWHLVRDKGESLMEFQLKNASFDRTDHNDGSNYNCMEIGRINGFNLLPDAIYPEIIGPYFEPSKGFSELGNTKMLRVHWLMLEAIAGIPVVDHFEIDLVPLKLQVERDVAKKLFEYVFPGVGGNAFEGSGFSPFMVKNMLPTQEEEEQEENKAGADASKVVTDSGSQHSEHGDGNGAGSLERRLVPTLHLPKQRKQKGESKGLGISGSHQSLHGFNIFQHSNKSRSQLPPRSAASRQALGSANASPIVRSPSERSLTTVRSEAGSAETEKNRRSLLHRSASDEGKRKSKKERSDDLTQMMNRASNYMTLAYVKLPSMVLCLSYKGKSARNIEDVHDLVFRMPTLEYRNKTWSNLDLALQLKKDVIKALISHAGTIVGNKFSHHKPSRQQQSRLRELANMSTLLAKDGSGPASETSSVREHSPSSYLGRPSTASGASGLLTTHTSHRSSESGSLRPGSGGALDNRISSVSRVNGHGREVSSGTQASSTPDLSTSGPGSGDTADTPPQQSRLGRASLSRRVSTMSQMLRPTDNPTDETEETKRKSKLLLGGQKLLRTFKD